MKYFLFYNYDEVNQNWQSIPDELWRALLDDYFQLGDTFGLKGLGNRDQMRQFGMFAGSDISPVGKIKYQPYCIPTSVVDINSYTEEVLSFQLIELASDAAKGDSLVEKRVAYLEKGLRHAELNTNVQRTFDEFRSGSVEKKVVRDDLFQLIEFRKTTEHDFIANYGFLYEWETKTWNIPYLRK